MPPKRRTRAARSRTCSENISDDGLKPPPDRKKRQRKKPVDDGTTWVDDDTLPENDNKLTLTIHVVESDSDSDSDYNPEEEEEFIQYLLERYVSAEPPSPKKTGKKKGKKQQEEPIPIKLTKTEQAYYNKQPDDKKRVLLDMMKRVSSHVLDEGEIPHKFRVLELPIADYVKSNVIKKISSLADIQSEGGEGHKLRTWVDAFMKIPFGKTVPLPVTIKDGHAKCSEFMSNARAQMNKHIYGMDAAKLQIMQIIAQWIVNPNAIGNVIALSGPPGVGKTSLARNAIADVLQRPFEFFTLGGASDIANYIGHSYTYEGSLWGRIVDALMHAKTMNPVMYFDELDKISTTPQGEEIASMMIHMTDRSQNTQFHDRYFAGVDFDLSQCLFIFSFNDADKVHPILRDRMTVIECGGYNEKDKSVILKDYIFPDILERLTFSSTDIILDESAIKFMITEYSSSEKGVRTLIRSLESMMTRINMLRIGGDDSMKDYPFYMKIELPLRITDSVVKKILCDTTKKEIESWRSLYT